MAAELENRCPICLDSWEEASYVLPCLHQFCYACILRWAESKPECPLCKRRVTSILHSVRGDDDFQEHVIPPPAAALVSVHQRGGAPGHPAAHNLRHPAAASQPSAAGLVPRAPVGSLHPHVWALLFRQQPALLQPLLPWLQQELGLIFRAGRWEAAAAQRVVLYSLHLFGLDEETLLQLLRDILGRHTESFVHRLIETIVCQCGGEARRQAGLGDARAAEEREGSPTAAPGPAASRGGSPAPSPALRGGPSSPPSAPVPTLGWQEEPQEDPGEAAPGPSAPSQGSEHSPGGSQQAPKRRAGSRGDPSQPLKKPPCHQ